MLEWACMHTFKNKIEGALKQAGIEINGPKPYDIQVKNERFYSQVALRGNLGAGESFVAGDFDVDQLDETFYRILKLPKSFIALDWPLWFSGLKNLLINEQSLKRAFVVGQKHYDLGLDLFEAMLDPLLVYSCGYWKDAKNLEDAQKAKLELVCKKMGLKKGMKVLDVGSGYGGFAKYAAENYGVEVTGVTVSQLQLEESQRRCQGLNVHFYLQDWRSVTGLFDRIVSIGQFEHVGTKNYSDYVRKMRTLLKSDGLFLLHTIGTFESSWTADPWLTKYIFPNGKTPSLTQISKAFEGQFVLEDLHNFGAYYDKTLMAWFQNFNSHWPELKEHYSERFYRIWKYYLLSCAGAFRARKMHLWQLVFSPNGVPDGYQSIR